MQYHIYDLNDNLIGEAKTLKDAKKKAKSEKCEVKIYNFINELSNTVINYKPRSKKEK